MGWVLRRRSPRARSRSWRALEQRKGRWRTPAATARHGRRQGAPWSCGGLTTPWRQRRGKAPLGDRNSQCRGSRATQPPSATPAPMAVPARAAAEAAFCGGCRLLASCCSGRQQQWAAIPRLHAAAGAARAAAARARAAAGRVGGAQTRAAGAAVGAAVGAAAGATAAVVMECAASASAAASAASAAVPEAAGRRPRAAAERAAAGEPLFRTPPRCAPLSITRSSR